MADQNEKGSSRKRESASDSGAHSTTSSARTDRPPIKLKKLELGGSRNPLIGNLVNSEVNFRPPTNSAQPGNATSKPQKPQSSATQPHATRSVEIDEIHNTGIRNPVIGQAVDTTLNFYDDPDDHTAPKVEKGEESKTESDDEESASSGEGRVCIGGGQPRKQQTASEGSQLNVGHLKITGTNCPVIGTVTGSTINM